MFPPSPGHPSSTEGDPDLTLRLGGNRAGGGMGSRGGGREGHAIHTDQAHDRLLSLPVCVVCLVVMMRRDGGQARGSRERPWILAGLADKHIHAVFMSQ